MTAEQTRPWLILLLFIAGTMAALQYAKLPWMIPGLLSMTPMSLLQQATLLSFIGVAGVAAGTVATPICNHFGLFNSLVFGLYSAAVGSLWPLMFHQNHALLLIGRGIESAAHIAIVISVPTLILRLATTRDQPRAMTLWSTYFTVTFIATAVCAPYLVNTSGWRSLPLLHSLICVFIAVALIRFRQALKTDTPQASRIPVRALSWTSLIDTQYKLIQRRRLRVIPLAFLGYTLLFVALVSTLPQTMSTERWSTPELALLFPIMSVCGAIIVSLALSRGCGSPAIIKSSAFVLLVISALLMIYPTQHPLSLPAMMAGFLVLGTLPGGILSSIPAIFTGNDPDIAIVSGGLVQFGNLGNFIGPPCLALLTQLAGTQSTGLYLGMGALIILTALRPLRHEVALSGHRNAKGPLS